MKPKHRLALVLSLSLALGTQACGEDTSSPIDDVADGLDSSEDVPDTSSLDASDSAQSDSAPDLPPPPAGRLVINEVSCRDLPAEWVEVLNIGDAAIDLGGMRITDSPRARGKLLPTRLLEPGERLVVQGDLGIGCETDSVYLMQLSRVVDEAPPTGGDAEVSSWGRIPDGTGEFSETIATPQKPNLPLEDERDSVFDTTGPMPIIDLYVDTEAEATLINAQKTYAPGLFTWTDADGTTAPQRVDIRIKGSITFRPWTAKPSLKLHFARHDDAGPRSFRGLKKLALHNLAYDPSAIREWLAYTLMRRLGQPAPRVAWATVRVNGEDKGLYGVIEPYDERFLADHFPSTQALYEADGDLGPGLYGFAADEGDTMAYVEALAERAVTARNMGYPATDWLTEVDWLAVARMMAHEDLLQHSDGMMSGCHNWFAHLDKDGLWSTMPWSADLVLITAWGVTGPLSQCSVLSQLCINDEVCRAWFVRARDEAAQLVLRGGFREPAIALATRAAEFARPTDEPWSSNEFWQNMPFDLPGDATKTIDLLETRARDIRCATALERGVQPPPENPNCGGFANSGTNPGPKPKEN